MELGVAILSHSSPLVQLGKEILISTDLPKFRRGWVRVVFFFGF